MDSETQAAILIVDDNPAKLLAFSAALSDLHQSVVTASSGREALRLLLHQEFVVVLLDINMPGMDGFETAALIRQRKSSEHTPIIFITAYPDDAHVARGYSLGAVDYILAPVDPEVLRSKVLVFVELSRTTAQVKLQAQALERRARQLQRLTEASLAINSALSPDQMLHVLTELALDILGAHQAVAVAAPDQNWPAVLTAWSLSKEYEVLGERKLFRDRAALLSFLSTLRKVVRIPRGRAEPERQGFFATDDAAGAGWLAAALSGRDGRHMGLIHLLDKRDGDFDEEDETVLIQLAQMGSIAIENAANAEAREANRIKDQFLTTLSHELRTPLSAILGWTRVLRTGRLQPARTEHALEVIERNVRAQAKLIDDLLDVSRIITGKIRLQIRRAKLTSVIEAAMDAMRPAAEAKDIRMHFAPGASGDHEIVGDPDRLQQVFWNLMSNAIKFTPPRGEVRVSLERRADCFEVHVADTGKGMSPEFLAGAFDRFRQADSSTTRSQGGLGIGLAIARHLVELHGGSIRITSPGENLGSTFSVSLPATAVGVEAAETSLPAVVETSVPEAFADLTGIKALVVEDQADAGELLLEILKAAGGQAALVPSAAEALALLDTFRPGVLVSDIGLPGEDGYSLLRRVRELPPESGGLTPAIAVSAYARKEDRLRSLSAGFQIHIPKPFEPSELVAAVARVARRPSASPPAGRSGDSAPEPPVSSPGRSDLPAPHRVLVIEDDADSRDGLRALLEDWGHAVDVAGTGAEGIRKAIEQQPRIALIDIGLPEVDGFEVALRLREALGRERIYLVALTGLVGQADDERTLTAGFDAHLPKPINFDKLSSLLTRCLP